VVVLAALIPIETFVRWANGSREKQGEPSPLLLPNKRKTEIDVTLYVRDKVSRNDTDRKACSLTLLQLTVATLASAT